MTASRSEQSASQRPSFVSAVLVTRCNVSGGSHPALSPSLRRERSCDATVLALLDDEGGVALALGRRRRTVPTYLRQVVEERDRGCRVHGCSQRRWLIVHHLVHWEDGGL